jgi:hypothetical protein
LTLVRDGLLISTPVCAASLRNLVRKAGQQVGKPTGPALFFGPVSRARLGLIPGTWFLRIAGLLFPLRFIIIAGHSDHGEKIENLIFVHKVQALCVKTQKVGTILSLVAA